MCTQYNIIAELEHSTVVAKYESQGHSHAGYQSESELDMVLVKNLREYYRDEMLRF